MRTYLVLFFCKTEFMKQNSQADDRRKTQTGKQSAYQKILRNKGFSIMNVFETRKYSGNQ